MNTNISENGSAVALKKGFEYLIIDALYLAQIKELISLDVNTELEDLKRLVREEAFPYSEAPFGQFYLEKDEFRIESIQRIGYDQNTDSDRRFSSDTGLVLVFQTSCFAYLIENFSYEDFTDSNIDLVNYQYWSGIVEPLEFTAIAAIIAPGIDSGFDFEGGGLYIVEEN